MDLLTELGHHLIGQAVALVEKHGADLNDPKVARLVQTHSEKCRLAFARAISASAVADQELATNLIALQALEALAESEKRNGNNA